MKYKVEIDATFNYGGWNQLRFKKEFILSFVPFIGLDVCFDEENELTIELTPENTHICYNVASELFYINRRKYWKPGTDSDIIQETLEKFKTWKRLDDTDIAVMKELMENAYKLTPPQQA